MRFSTGPPRPKVGRQHGRMIEDDGRRRKTETENAEYGSTTVALDNLDPLDNNVMNTGAIFGTSLG